MTVDEAVTARRSIRAFLPRPVPLDTVRGVLERAARAPSGGNLQPWRIHVVTDAPLSKLKALMAVRAREVPQEAPVDYEIYPTPLPEPYKARRTACGEAMYALLDIARTDRERRWNRLRENFQLFGAPLGLFCCVDRCMGAPQWADLGMYLQTVMLLLKARGLDSCAQEAWALYPRTMAAFLRLPDDQMLFCGMAVGWADPDAPVNRLVTERAPLEAFVRFHTGDADDS
ncbi:nitroreductase [Azospirillum sp. INR13]|nr:nitroreductase [Azospirillum sp. INR13]